MSPSLNQHRPDQQGTEWAVGPRPDAPTGEAERRIIDAWREQMLAELPADHPARARLEAVRIDAAA